jgi:hypothetical protein
MSTNVSENSNASIFNVREYILPTEKHNIILHYHENSYVNKLKFNISTLRLKDILKVTQCIMFAEY